MKTKETGYIHISNRGLPFEALKLAPKIMSDKGPNIIA